MIGPTAPDHAALGIIRACAALVRAASRRDWIERWDAELWALAAEGAPASSQRRFALSAFRDAFVEGTAGRFEGWTAFGIGADIRQALRRARREPVTTAVAVMVMGAGTAAAASLFALFDATLLRDPAGIERPAELMQVGRDGPEKFDPLSYPNYRDLADAVGETVTLSAFGTGAAVVGRSDDADVVDAQFVTANYFRVAGTTLQRPNGGWPQADTHAAAAILSDRYWQQHRATIEAAGFTLRVDGRTVAVAGVASPAFTGLAIGAPPPALWLPLSASERSSHLNTERGWSWLTVIGRRRPDVTFSAARAAIVTAHANLSRRYATTIGDTITVIERAGFRPAERREATRVFALLLGAALLVMLVATANVTGLHLARAAADQPATALRASLGASRARLVRAALIDQWVIAASGGIVAWLAAQWMTGAIRAMLPYDLAIAYSPGLRTMGFALVLPTLASAAVAAVPTWRAVRLNVGEVIRGAGRGHTARPTLSRVLVTIELAVATGLLVASGVMLRSLSEAAHADPGFDATEVSVISLRRQAGARPAAEIRADIVDRLRGVPGTQAVGLSTRLPIARPQSTRSMFVADAAYDPDARPVAVVINAVDRGFFDALRIAVPSGITWPDRTGAAPAEWPVAATPSAVRELWPDPGNVRPATSGALRLLLAAPLPDVHTRSLQGAAGPAVFLPLGLTDEAPSFALVRTSLSSAVASAALRSALAPLSSDLIVQGVEPYAPMLVASLSETVLAARLGVPLAGIAILLAAMGLYSAAARRVTARRREFGVRLALGAEPSAIVRAELASTLRLAVPAFLAGLLLVGLAEPVLSRAMFAVRWRDPFVLSAAAVVMLLVPAGAAFVPARRASRTDPLEAIRE